MLPNEYLKAQYEFIKKTGVTIGSLVKLSDFGNDWNNRDIEDEFLWEVGYVRDYVNDGKIRQVGFITKSDGFDVGGIWYPWCVIDPVKVGTNLQLLRNTYPDHYKKSGINSKHLELLNEIMRIYPYNFWDVWFSIINKDLIEI